MPSDTLTAAETHRRVALLDAFLGKLRATRHGTTGRDQLLMYVTAAAELVDALDPVTDLVMPYVALGRALGDLDRGAVHPLLQPRKASGRPRDTRERESAKAIAAAMLVNLRRAAGCSEQEAAKAVAGELHRLGFAVRYSDPVTGQATRLGPATVKEWRRQIEELLDPDAPIVAMYRTFVEHDRPRCDTFREEIEAGRLSREVVIRELLAGLARALAMLPAAKG
jgi:hypothetical protein